MTRYRALSFGKLPAPWPATTEPDVQAAIEAENPFAAAVSITEVGRLNGTYAELNLHP